MMEPSAFDRLEELCSRKDVALALDPLLSELRSLLQARASVIMLVSDIPAPA